MKILWALAFALGCNATETGNPSFAPTLDDTITVTMDGSPLPGDPSPARFAGAAGTVDPPEGEILAWNLDTDAAIATAPIEADGSFEVFLFASPSNQVRLQVRAEEFSAPVTLQLSIAAGPSDVVPEGCLNAAVNAFEAPGTIEFVSTCEGLEGVAATLRGTGEPLDATGDLTFSVGAIADPDVVLVTATARGAPIRAAVTVVPGG